DRRRTPLHLRRLHHPTPRERRPTSLTPRSPPKLTTESHGYTTRRDGTPPCAVVGRRADRGGARHVGGAGSCSPNVDEYWLWLDAARQARSRRCGCCRCGIHPLAACAGNHRTRWTCW